MAKSADVQRLCTDYEVKLIRVYMYWKYKIAQSIVTILV